MSKLWGAALQASDFKSNQEKSDLFRAIVGRWKLVVIVSGALFAGLAFLITSITPRYAAETMLLLPSAPVKDLAEKAAPYSAPQTDPFLIKSYIDVIKSDDIDRQVIRQLDLTHSPEFAKRPGLLHPIVKFVKGLLPTHPLPDWTKAEVEEGRVLSLYQKRLKAFNDGHSLTLMLSFEAADPKLAALIVNAQAKAYISNQIAYRSNEERIKTTWLKAQLAEAAQDVRSAQIAVQMHPLMPGRREYDAADGAAELKSRQAIADAKRNVYESLLSRYMVLAAEQQYVGADTRIVSTASAPTIPKSPNVPLFLAVAALISLLTGAIAAAARSYLSSSLDLNQVSADIGLKALGTLRIPRVLDVVALPRTRRIQRACFWEQVRAVRSSLPNVDRPGVVTAVMSASANSGTSLLAASLARAIASCETRTLLIDLDVRRPSAHEFFQLGLKEKAGLGEVLHGSARLDEALMSAGGGNFLYVLTVSQAGFRNIDLLSGVQFRRLVDHARSLFDAVILDTPPFGVVSDALNATALADTSLLVSKPEDVASGRMKAAIAALKQRNISLAGFVMTGDTRPLKSALSELKPYLVDDPLAKVQPRPGKMPKAIRGKPTSPAFTKPGLATRKVELMVER